MKSSLGATIVLLAVAVSGCNAGTTGASGTPESLEDKAGYAIGLQLGQNLRQQGADVDVDRIAQGVRDGFEGEEPALTSEDIQATMMEFQQLLASTGESRLAEDGSTNKTAGDAYLAENAGKAGVIVLESGLQYEVLQEGSGASPTATDQVTVHYEGRLIDGSLFESSYDSGQPARFPLNQVIPGWTEGVQLMRVGSKYRFHIPGEIAYGMNAGPGGPNATLVFEVELLAINGQS